MSGRVPRTHLDALIAARRWTVPETLRRFSTTAADLGESATLSEVQLKRWRHGLLREQIEEFNATPVAALMA